MAYIYRLCNKLTSFSNPRNPTGGIPRLGQWTKAHERYVRAIQAERQKDTTKPSFMSAAHQAISYNEYIHHGRASTKAVPKVARQIAAADDDDNNGTDLSTICQILMQLGGVSHFRAWQLACDLEEANCFGQVSDNYTLLSPGAKNGLNDIFGDALVDDCHDNLQLVKYLQNTMTYCSS